MPLEPNDVGKLRDMIEFGEKVAGMIQGMPLNKFMADEKTLFAVCYGLQVVGEAGWKLSDSFKRAHAEIPWPLIAGMRHRLVHDYGRTDESVVFNAASIHLPKLLEQVRAILANEASGY
jgi:uncharacterized protein with HEPN domain